MEKIKTNKNYVLLGFGKIGKNIVYDLMENNKDRVKISVYDPYVKPNTSKFPGVNFFSSDPFTENIAKRIFNDDNVVISALPPQFMQKAYDFTIKLGGNLVDIASVHTNITELLKNKGDFLIVPEFGVAPGISNFLVGHFIADMDEIDNIKIYVGGLPTKPLPPMEYKITWSSTGLINMYLNPVEIYENGSLKVVEPLTGLEELKIAGFDYPLEAFYTDGLATLKYTIKNVKNMFEKTIRYKGHAEKISLLKALGFFESKKITISGDEIRPRDLTEALFEEKLKAKEVGDILLMHVYVDGRTHQKEIKKKATLIYSKEADSPYTAMSQTTGFPASIVAQMISKGKFSKLKGYIPPQNIGKVPYFFDEIIKELKKRGVEISIG
jgi:saccharopine dehydrogenase-like NADP-dependent oxidoreductase